MILLKWYSHLGNDLAIDFRDISSSLIVIFSAKLQLCVVGSWSENIA